MQSFLVKHQITQVTQASYSPDLALCDLWLFPKLKSPLKGKRFQTVDEIQENTTGQLMVIPTKDFAVFWTVGELCEVPRSLLWRGRRRHCPMYNVSCIFFNKCIFHSLWLDTFWTDPVWLFSLQIPRLPTYPTPPLFYGCLPLSLIFMFFRAWS